MYMVVIGVWLLLFVAAPARRHPAGSGQHWIAPSLPTKSTPVKIRRFNISGKFPMDMRIPPLEVRFCLGQTL